MLNRREFLKLCMGATLSLSLGELLIPHITQAFQIGEIRKPPFIWLELGSCVGNSVSLENASNPTLIKLLLDVIDLRYHWTVMAAQGDLAVQTLMDTVKNDAGEFYLVVEGSVMTAHNGKVNYVFARDGQRVTGLQALQEIAPKAKHIISVGDCACFGGPSAMYPNPGGAKGVWDIIKNRTIINVPGCPAHPDWMIGTFTHLMMYGMPELDAYNRPKMFFSKTIHELCHRRQQFEDGQFAKFPGDDGCLYTVGCKGPVTYADCPVRQWNHYQSWPVENSTPCIGCTSPNFPDGMMPFFKHLPELNTPLVKVRSEQVAMVAGGATTVGIASHLVANIAARRFHKHHTEGTSLGEMVPPETPNQMRNTFNELMNKEETLLAQAKNMVQQQKKPRKRRFLRKLADYVFRRKQ
jgi:hydrogenase small subunit